MEKQQKKRIRKYISWALIVAIVALLAAAPMIAAKEEPEAGPRASILSAEAENRDISTAVLGGGALIAEDAVEITIPAAVKVKEYLVSNGDVVTEGQSVATVDRVSVMTAITQVQETMDYLQEQLEDVSDDTADQEVTASAGGTVKIIYGADGEHVQDVILRDGALAVLSLDGLMAVQIQRSTGLSGGDTVCVTFSDGTEADGKVESNLEGILTVTVDDDGFAVGEEVKVTTEDGDRIGSGSLFIHSQWNVIAYSGTISGVQISEGDTVTAGKTLFNLANTGHTAEFDALARQHREYEQLMLELFKMYQSETVTAPADGMITGVDESGAYMLCATGGWTISFLVNSPNGDDDTAYVNYIGQVTEVGIDGLVMKINPQPLAIADYKDLSAVPMDTALMTEDAVYTATAPVYTLSGDEWVQIDPASIAAGDILLFAGDADGNFVWVVRVTQESSQPDVPEESEPTDSTDPSTSTDPTQPEGNTHQGSGNTSGFGGGAVQEEAFTLYGLDTLTIASVTPQERVTIQITVDELDISQIYLGQSVQITVDALSGEKFAGTVTDLSNSGTNDGGNSKFTVTVSAEKKGAMLPGMTAYVSIVLNTTESIPCIPVAALIETGTETIVYTGYDEETEEFIGAVKVMTGISDGEYVQILSGITEGKTVFYPYYDTLDISNEPEMTGGFRFG